jgi:hypothetical protein
MATKKIITEFGRLWSREIFDILEENKLTANNYPSLKMPGVYILYRDDFPYYIGKSKTSLFSRLHKHSNVSSDKYFNFWNYFSFFVVPDEKHVDEIEGILIASMPTANRAVPKIKEITIPRAVAKRLRENRRNNVKSKI